jgi:hypothetical protein
MLALMGHKKSESQGLKLMGVRLPQELVRKIKVYAAVAGITTQEMIRKAMLEYVAAHPMPAAAPGRASTLTPIKITAGNIAKAKVKEAPSKDEPSKERS